MPPRRAKVVLLVENLPVPLDRRVWQEAQALSGDGWDVTIISPRGQQGMHRLRESIQEIEILRYPQRAASGLAGYLIEYLPSLAFTAIWLLRIRLRGPIHVIHACNPPDLFWLFAPVARLWGGHFVFDQHDANPELAMTKWRGHGLLTRLLVGFTKWLERRSYAAATLVIAPNDSYRDLAVRRGKLDPGKVVVVRNAPDVGQYQSLAGNIAQRNHDVGYVGVMGSQDGIDILIDAWRLVRDAPDMTDASLHLVGDGEARERLEGQVARLRLTDSVVFHGYLRPTEFVPVLAACAVCVAPDPPTPFNAVSTMVKVIDYLAIGRGVVSFDLAETRLVAGSAACIAAKATPRALADSILEVLRDAPHATRLGLAAREQVALMRLDWNLSARVLLEHYAELRPVRSAHH
jgi:glycosyltransferase involved in cell wall biosynthesis